MRMFFFSYVLFVMLEGHTALIPNFMTKIFRVVFYNGDSLYFDFFLYIAGDI